MDHDIEATGRPLTRRMAREIERKTGVRPVARHLDPEDTGRIERADVAEFVPVMPAPTAPPAAGTAFSAAGRAFTVRASRPTSLVRVQRSRMVAGGAVAVSAAAVAALGAIAPSQLAGAANAGDADLLAASQQNTPNADALSDAIAASAAPDAAFTADSVVARTSGTVEGATDIESVAAAAVEASVEAPAPEPAPAPAPVSRTASSSTASSESRSSESRSASSGTVGASIVESALSWVGKGMYGRGNTPSSWDCGGFVQYIYSHQGIPLTYGSVSTIAAQGTPTKNPQAGDLVVFGSSHVGIYDGNGGIIDSSKPGHSITHRSIWSQSHYFVRIG